MGKYSKELLDELPQYRGSEATYQDKVDIKAREIYTRFADNNPAPTPLVFATEYQRLREKKDEINKQLSEVNLELEAVSQILIVEFETRGLTKLRFSLDASDKRLIYIQSEPYAQVQNTDEFRLWCVKNGLERSLQLPFPTTNSITKQRLLAGEPEPDGVVAFMKTKIVFRRKGESGEDE